MSHNISLGGLQLELGDRVAPPADGGAGAETDLREAGLLSI